MANIVKAASPQRIPVEIAKLLGEPTLWRGESREQYDATLLAIAISVEARDVVDWLSVKEVTYHVWDHRRLEGIKAALILAKQSQIIEELLKTTYDSERPVDMIYYISGAKNDAHRWKADAEVSKKIDELLATRGHDRASILAKAYLLCAHELQALDKAIADREVRRMATLREIQRRDEYLARRLQRASQEIIDGEFSEAAE
jgi:DNA mismatch repair ATPase MutS